MTVITGTGLNNTLSGGTAADFINGLAGNDTLYGNGGNDFLIGGAGLDKVYGGSGDDVFQVGDQEAMAGEIYNGGTGFDTLRITSLAPSVNYAVVDFKGTTITSIEALSFAGRAGKFVAFDAASIGAGLSSTLSLQGNTSSNSIEIDMGTTDSLDLSGWTFSNFTGRITIWDDNSGHVMTGTSQADTFDIRGNYDKAHGGGGDDVFNFEGYLTAPGELDGGDGTDTIQIYGDATLDLRNAVVTGIEVIKFDSSEVFYEPTLQIKATQFGASGFSSALNIQSNAWTSHVDISLDYLTSFSAASFQLPSYGTIISITGNDTADVITGSQGADRLYGNGGDDHLNGGQGNDNLDGGTGADVMRGGAGHDGYYVDNAGDKVEEVVNGVDSGGLDAVYSYITYTLTAGVESLILMGSNAIDGTGNALDNSLRGNDLSNALSGLGGADTLIGGKGQDTLTGGGGADIFKYEQILDSQSGALNRDIITDFKVGVDKISLSSMDAILSTNTYEHFVQDSNGVFEAGEFRITESNGNTVISLNLDSNTTPDMQILLQNVIGVTAADFIL